MKGFLKFDNNEGIGLEIAMSILYMISYLIIIIIIKTNNMPLIS